MHLLSSEGKFEEEKEMKKYHMFSSPERTIYGWDAFSSVGKEVAQRGKKALIVGDEIMQKLGNLANCQQLLMEEGIESVLYTGVASEPTDKYVEEALALFKEEGCDVIISLGGGSCLDTAKAVAVLATNGGYIGDYMGGAKPITYAPAPHFAIPTTAGTGSEVTDVTVVTNTTTDEKMMIKAPQIMPTVAIVDPALTMSSPKKVTAATGVDALSHAVEAYLSKLAQPMTDTLALQAIELIATNLKTAYENPENHEAREAMSLGSMYAGMAFSNASVCLVHGMSRPIGALFNVPHGESNAMLLPAVLEFSQSHCPERLAVIGRIFDSKAAEQSDEAAVRVAIEQIKKLCLTLNIPNLETWGIDKKAYEASVEKMADDAIRSGSPNNNPRVPSKEEIQALYHTCYNYEF